MTRIGVAAAHALHADRTDDHTVTRFGILAAIAYPQYGQYVTKARAYPKLKAALARVQGAQRARASRCRLHSLVFVRPR